MPFQRGGYKWGELFVFISYSHLSASEDKQPTANCRLEEVEKEKKNQRPTRDRITTSASPHTFCACVYAQSSFFCGEKIQTLIKRTRWRRKNAKIFLFLFFTNVNFFSLFPNQTGHRNAAGDKIRMRGTIRQGKKVPK